jgi:hypothetical protein
MPLYPPRPSPRPKPGPPSGRKPARPVKGQAARIRWGWLEWFIVSQTALPALVFLPGVSASPTVRNVTRIALYCREENKVPLGFVVGINNKISVIQRPVPPQGLFLVRVRYQ